MKKYIYLVAFFSVAMAFAQEHKVGINTSEPKTTLEVVAPTDTTHPAGMQAPRVTRAELTALASSYTREQEGTLVYVTDVTGGDATGQRALVTEKGYYYFNGNQWERMVSTAEYANIYIKNGILTDHRTVTQNDKTLTFTKTTGLTVFQNTTGSPLQIKDGAQGEGQVLSSDNEGNAFWDVAAVSRVEGSFSETGGIPINTTGNSGYYNTGAKIKLTEGKWALSFSGELGLSGTQPTTGAVLWVTVYLGTKDVPGYTLNGNAAALGIVTGDASFSTDGKMNTDMLAAGIANFSLSGRNNIKGMAMIKVPKDGGEYYVYVRVIHRIAPAPSDSTTGYKVDNYFKAGGENTYFYALRLAD